MNITAHKAITAEPFGVSTPPGNASATLAPRANRSLVAAGQTAAKTSRPADATAGVAAGAKRIIGALFRLGMRTASGIAAERRMRRDLQHLLAMDDHMLNDIGLARADIEALRYGRDR